MLANITKKAWDIIATTSQDHGGNDQNKEVANNATSVANLFTERLLRTILSLRRKQQLALVRDFAHADKHKRIPAGKRGGKGNKARDNITGFERGTNKEYLLARIQR